MTITMEKLDLKTMLHTETFSVLSESEKQYLEKIIVKHYGVHNDNTRSVITFEEFSAEFSITNDEVSEFAKSLFSKYFRLGYSFGESENSISVKVVNEYAIFKSKQQIEYKVPQSFINLFRTEVEKKEESVPVQQEELSE